MWGRSMVIGDSLDTPYLRVAFSPGRQAGVFLARLGLSMEPCFHVLSHREPGPRHHAETPFTAESSVDPVSPCPADVETTSAPPPSRTAPMSPCQARYSASATSPDAISHRRRRSSNGNNLPYRSPPPRTRSGSTHRCEDCGNAPASRSTRRPHPRPSDIPPRRSRWPAGPRTRCESPGRRRRNRPTCRNWAPWATCRSRWN